MTTQSTSPAQPQALSEKETDALNKHGVFFKKRVLQELRRVWGLEVVCEELGVSFCGTRVIDIVAVDKRAHPHIYFVFECKRAYAADRRWIFFRDFDPAFRLLRVQEGRDRNSSVFADDSNWLTAMPVCSEGYEYANKESKADQDPVFKASAQLAAGYLGLIARRHQDKLMHPGNNQQERFVPILVTTAELSVTEANLQISLETGNATNQPAASQANVVVLKHPFPTPAGMDVDLRDFPNPLPSEQYWNQLHKESIYVVKAHALQNFLKGERLDYWRSR